MQEIWKDIKEYSGKYQISNWGNVRKINKDYRSPANKILKKQCQYKGYYTIDLHDENGYHKHLIHRLVAEAFIPNPQNKPQVNHKDGDKSNNCVDNLEWCTEKENIVHSIKVLNKKRNTYKQRNAARIVGKTKRKLTLEQAINIRNEAQKTKRKDLAKKYNVSLSVIDNIVTNKRYIN